MEKKIILYYKFVKIKDPYMTKLWQQQLCESLNLKGRILISEHGINGTLGGSLENLLEYKRAMNASDIFRGIVYKWSAGSDKDFPRLSVKNKKEIVAFNASDEIEVSEKGIENGGKHIKPENLEKLLEEKGQDVIFYDGRNAFEAKIGKFKNAIVPNVKTSRDFKEDIEKGEISKHKDKPIVTYCTGGIRCEILSAMMKNRGYKDVYQIDGGIVKYGEKFGKDGLWEGKCYVFDKRMTVEFDSDTEDIGDCSYCDIKTSNYINCSNKLCNQLILVCKDCSKELYCPDCAKNYHPVAV
jgi:UPF0176 protein